MRGPGVTKANVWGMELIHVISERNNRLWFYKYLWRCVLPPSPRKQLAIHTSSVLLSVPAICLNIPECINKRCATHSIRGYMCDTGRDEGRKRQPWKYTFREKRMLEFGIAQRRSFGNIMACEHFTCPHADWLQLPHKPEDSVLRFLSPLPRLLFL